MFFPMKPNPVLGFVNRSLTDPILGFGGRLFGSQREPWRLMPSDGRLFGSPREPWHTRGRCLPPLHQVSSSPPTTAISLASRNKVVKDVSIVGMAYILDEAISF